MRRPHPRSDAALLRRPSAEAEPRRFPASAPAAEARLRHEFAQIPTSRSGSTRTSNNAATPARGAIPMSARNRRSRPAKSSAAKTRIFHCASSTGCAPKYPSTAKTMAMPPTLMRPARLRQSRSWDRACARAIRAARLARVTKSSPKGKKVAASGTIRIAESPAPNVAASTAMPPDMTQNRQAGCGNGDRRNRTRARSAQTCPCRPRRARRQRELAPRSRPPGTPRTPGPADSRAPSSTDRHAPKACAISNPGMAQTRRQSASPAWRK